MRDLTYENRLRRLKLPTLEYRRYRGDMIEMYKLTHGLYDHDVTTDFLEFNSNACRGHPYKVFKRGCRLDVRKFSFKLRTTDKWNNLPESVVTANSMNCFKSRFDKLWRGTTTMCYHKDNLDDTTSCRI